MGGVRYKKIEVAGGGLWETNSDLHYRNSFSSCNMNSLAILKSLVSHLEPRRAEWIQVQRNGRGHYFHQHESFGKNYLGAVYNLDKMMNTNYMSWYDIYSTMCCYLFQNIKIPYKSYSIAYGGLVNCEEIYEHLNRFIYDNGARWGVDLHKYRIPLGNDNSPGERYRNELCRSLSEVNIPVSSVKEYLEYLITLEEKYSVNPENIVRYKGDIEKVDTMLKEREEREKKEAERKERIRIEREELRRIEGEKKEKEKKEEEECIRIQREKKEKEEEEEEERKKMEEDAKAFEEEVQRCVKLELYERRVRAEVERRLKALDDAKVEAAPVEEAVVQATEVKETVKEEVKPQEKKPQSILERLKKFI